MSGEKKDDGARRGASEPAEGKTVDPQERLLRDTLAQQMRKRAELSLGNGGPATEGRRLPEPTPKRAEPEIEPVVIPQKRDPAPTKRPGGTRAIRPNARAPGRSSPGRSPRKRPR